MAGWRNWHFSFGEPGASARPSESIRGVRVSPSFFTMLGVRPAVGRGFEAGEEQPGHDRVGLLTHAFWVRRFQADRAVVGRSVLIDGGRIS